MRISVRSLAALAVVAPLLLGPLAVATSAAGPIGDADAALTWIEGELAADGGSLTTAYDDGSGGVATFPDWGLTIDALLALAAGGRGTGSAATTAADRLEANVGDYVTGGVYGPDDRYAGALAKTLLVAEVLGRDAADFGGWDVPAELRARLQTTGADAGRFSDLSAYGDFSNGFGQALALLALARTDDGVPPAAVDFLLAQQCPGGEFRGDYTTAGGCADDAEASVDATGFAVQALTAVPPTCATRQAVAAAVDALQADQDASGAFGSVSGQNANSTGLAAVALRSLGSSSAAESAAGFVADLQVVTGDDAGAVALNAAGFAAAGDGIQVLERDGFRRATTQGVLAFGLPSYAEIGTDPVDPAALAPCTEPDPDPVPSGSLSSTTVAPGDTVTVTASGFEPAESVALTLHSTPVELGATTADAVGSLVMSFTVPADLEPGAHSLELTGATSARVLSLGFEVTAPPTPGAAPELPRTGSAVAAETAVGLGLVSLGGALLLAARRRRGAVT